MGRERKEESHNKAERKNEKRREGVPVSPQEREKEQGEDIWARGGG